MRGAGSVYPASGKLHSSEVGLGMGPWPPLRTGRDPRSLVVRGARGPPMHAGNLFGPEVTLSGDGFHTAEAVLGAGGAHHAPAGFTVSRWRSARVAFTMHWAGSTVRGGSRRKRASWLGVRGGLYADHHSALDGHHGPKVARCPGFYPALYSGWFSSPQGPKKNQIQWTVLDSPGRKATPLFRGKTGRATSGPSRDQIRLCGFDSRRLQLSPAEAGCQQAPA